MDRGVFDPVKHLSGIAFADHLPTVLRDVAPNAKTAIEIGTGCGLLAATLAQAGLSVIATDISERAVRCAQRNCRGLDVEVRQSDLFAALPDLRANLVVVNPPYDNRRPSRRRPIALTSPDFLERFGTTVRSHAPCVLVGFPADDRAGLHRTGLPLELVYRIPTAGHDLGIFVAELAPPPAALT